MSYSYETRDPHGAFHTGHEPQAIPDLEPLGCEECDNTEGVMYYHVAERFEYGRTDLLIPLCPICKLRAESEGATVVPNDVSDIPF